MQRTQQNAFCVATKSSTDKFVLAQEEMVGIMQPLIQVNYIAKSNFMHMPVNDKQLAGMSTKIRASCLVKFI